MDIRARVEAAIELLNVKSNSLPRMQMADLCEAIERLMRVKRHLQSQAAPNQCLGGRLCTCCNAGCDCGCVESCPQWQSQQKTRKGGGA